MEMYKHYLLAIIDQNSFDRIRLWLKYPYLISNRSTNIIITGVLGQHTPYCIKQANHLRDSYDIGLVLNELRKTIPNFIYTFYYIKSGLPIYDGEKVMTWFLPPRGNIAEVDYLFLECLLYAPTLSRYLRETDISLDTVIKIYLQLIYALNSANTQYSFIHGNMITNKVLIRYCEKSNRIILDDENYIDSDVIPVIVDYSKSSIVHEKTVVVKNGTVTMDIYTLTRDILQNLVKRNSPSLEIRNAVNFFKDILLDMAVPYAIVNMILRLDISPLVTDPKFNYVLDYNHFIIILHDCLAKSKLDHLILYSKEPPRSQELNIKHLLKASSDSFIEPINGFLSLCYQGKPYDKVLHYKYSTGFNDYMHKSKEGIKLAYTDINSNIFEINNHNLSEILVISMNDMNKISSEYTLLFKNLLSIRVLLDDLEIRHKHRIQLISDIENELLENYIKENRAKLLRITGENKYIYTNCKKIINFDLITEIEIIWYVLNHESVNTA